MSKPPLKWAGGKRKLLPSIMPLLPTKYNRYIEPFSGGASLFFRLKPENAILCDINEELINFYKILRDDHEGLIESLKKHENTEEYYFKIRDVDRTEGYKSWTNVERASRFLYLNKTCFNGLHRVNSKGHFNVPFGNRKSPNIVDEFVLRRCSRILTTADLRTDDFKEIMPDIEQGNFIYCDPPYDPISKTASFTGYSKEDFGDADQARLKGFCEYAASAGAYFAVSNSDTEFIRDLYKDYCINTIQAARSINSKGAGRGKVNEVFITNYEVEQPTKFIWEM